MPVSPAQNVDFIEWIIDGWQRYTSSGWGASTPYTLPVDTTTFSNGKHTIQPVSYTGPQRTFLPTSLTGCVLWVDFADTANMTLASNAVGSINDKSGTVAAFTQGTAGQCPAYIAGSLTTGLNGLGYASFTAASSQILTSSGSLTAAAGDVFMVAEVASNSQFIWGQSVPTSANNFLIFETQNVPPQVLEINGDFGGTIRTMRGTVTIINGNFFLSNFRCIGSPTNAYDVYSNGTEGVTGSNNDGSKWFSGLTGTQQMTIGGIVINNATSYGTVKVCEIIAFSRALNSTERLEVETYLAEKWGTPNPLTSQVLFGSYAYPPGSTISYSVTNEQPYTINVSNPNGIQLPTIANHYSHIKTGALNYVVTSLTADDKALCTSAIDVALFTQPGAAADAKTASPFTTTIQYQVLTEQDYFETLDWNNYADARS